MREVAHHTEGGRTGAPHMSDRLDGVDVTRPLGLQSTTPTAEH